ncbi:MAG TPA: hypothetical protein VGD41_15275, partial [Pyrinomonadaceae bacterium]
PENSERGICTFYDSLWHNSTTMAVPDRRIEAEETNRTLIIVVAVIAAVVIAGLFYGLMRLSGRSTASEQTLQGAIREGSPQFEEQRKNIVLDDPEATEAKRALGDIVMSLQSTVRNLTGKTLVGLEVRGVVVDYNGKPIKQKTVVIVPTRQPELAPNKTMQVNVLLDGFSETDARANIKMEVVAFKFKE